VRIGTWMYHRDEEGERLFDLALDPGERTDLKEQNPERFTRLRAVSRHSPHAPHQGDEPGLLGETAVDRQ
jgi:hypothetical protein